MLLPPAHCEQLTVMTWVLQTVVMERCADEAGMDKLGVTALTGTVLVVSTEVVVVRC